MAEDPGQANADATVAAAIAAGICEFDTAPWYGLGASEERLGRAVAAHPTARVITKAGRLIRKADHVTLCEDSLETPGATPLLERVPVNDYTAVGARTSLAESLARLRLEKVWGLRIHDPNDNSTKNGDEVAAAIAADGMCAGLRQMREEGTIQHVSLGMNACREAHLGAPDQIIRLIRFCPERTFDAALLAGGWNLLCQAAIPCLMECEHRGIPVHIAGVFASGLLVGGSTYVYKEAPREMVEKTAKWRSLAQKHRVSLTAVAIAFAALPKIVDRLIIGMATPQQVSENMAAVKESHSVPVDIWHESKAMGLLEDAVPLPSHQKTWSN